MKTKLDSIPAVFVFMIAICFSLSLSAQEKTSDLPETPKEPLDVISFQGEYSLFGKWYRCYHSLEKDEQGNQKIVISVDLVQFPGPREVNFFTAKMDACPEPSSLPNNMFDAPEFTKKTYWLVGKMTRHNIYWHRGILGEQPMPVSMPEKLSVTEFQKMSNIDGAKSQLLLYIDESGSSKKLYVGGSRNMSLLDTFPFQYIGNMTDTKLLPYDFKTENVLFSKIIESYTKKLKGIEAIYMRFNKEEPELLAEQLIELMLYHKEPVPKILQEIFYNREERLSRYSIELVDRRSGFMRSTCIGCEETTEMTYWNVSDGSQVIAVNSRGCGPVCEDYLSIFNLSGEKNKAIPAKNYIKPLTDFLIDSSNSAFFEQDAWELLNHLPRKGKNIMIKLEGVTNISNYKNIFKGNCYYLIWKDGYFEQGDITFCE